MLSLFTLRLCRANECWFSGVNTVTVTPSLMSDTSYHVYRISYVRENTASLNLDQPCMRLVLLFFNLSCLCDWLKLTWCWGISCTSPSWIYWYLKIDHLWGTENHAYILSEPVTLIVNDILMSGEFPSLWKRAEVFPVSMNSNPENIKDYRPISLLYHPSKIAERFISHKIQEGIPNTPNQYAYTRQLGTTEPQNHLLMLCFLNVFYSDHYPVPRAWMWELSPPE